MKDEIPFHDTTYIRDTMSFCPHCHSVHDPVLKDSTWSCGVRFDVPYSRTRECYRRGLESVQQRINVLENETNDLRRQIREMTTFLLRMENFINRFFDPEDLGYVVTPSVRDDAREALGRERVES